MSGTVVSLDPQATDVVLGGTSTVGLGSLTMNGFGIGGGEGASGSGTATGTAIEVSTGEAGWRGSTIGRMLVEMEALLGALEWMS